MLKESKQKYDTNESLLKTKVSEQVITVKKAENIEMQTKYHFYKHDFIAGIYETFANEIREDIKDFMSLPPTHMKIPAELDELIEKIENASDIEIIAMYLYFHDLTSDNTGDIVESLIESY